MLFYHPAYDVNHCALRMLSLLSDVDESPLRLEKIRILDFYVLFPSLLMGVRIPRPLVSKRRMLKALPSHYEAIPNSTRLLYEIAKYQDLALRSLVAKQIIERDTFSQGLVRAQIGTMPEEAKTLLDKQSFRTTDWYLFIAKDLATIPELGKDGLKNRTGLMEFRHDIA